MSRRQLRHLPRRIQAMHTTPLMVHKPTASVGIYGEQLNEDSTLVPTKGRIIGLRKKDYEDYGDQEGATTMYRISLPLDTDVGAGYEIEYDGVRFEIIGIDRFTTDLPDLQVIVAVRDNVQG